MKNVFRAMLLVVVCVPVCLSLAMAAPPSSEKKSGEKKAPVDNPPPIDTSLDVRGAPGGGLGGMRGFSVWHGAETWHLRTHSAPGVLYRFNGTIHVVGGKVTELGGIDSMEVTSRQKTRDVGVLNAARDTITFSFLTGGGWDGMNFRVDDQAEKVVFSLMMGGRMDPRFVNVGNMGQHPSTPIFSLAAHPYGGRPSENPKKEQSDKPAKGRGKKAKPQSEEQK
jgi:hypothetical protein